jgi:uncharacterized flavoprotein (TIGR03862 family)
VTQAAGLPPPPDAKPALALEGCSRCAAVVIGAGPAGLMAAEVLAQAGVQVDVFDAMPSVGRKFLLAGKGGLNLTHAEPEDLFRTRYRQAQTWLSPALTAFGPAALREWVQGLGIATFVGTSGRVFPQEMKAAPMLRAWLQRLRRQGVRFHMRHRWMGWNSQGELSFSTPGGTRTVQSQVTVLALGGASWSRLGSDGAWVPWLRAQGVEVAELQPSNCGFDVEWSDHFRDRFQGAPLKSVALEWEEWHGGPDDASTRRRQLGEFVITASGVEGSLIYAASAALREHLQALVPGHQLEQGSASRVVEKSQVTCWVDLLPARSAEFVLAEVARGRGTRSLSTHLKSRLGLDGVKMGLLHEKLTREQMMDAPTLARAIKALPIELVAPRPIDEAISSAGGVCFSALDGHLMLRQKPGAFCAGEMLDWEAPTGGYLLTACFATGLQAGEGAVRWTQAGD